MSVGIIFLVHDKLDRAAQVVRFWSNAGFPVVIHLDKKVSKQGAELFKEQIADLDAVRFCKRFSVEWGMWSVVTATLEASELLLNTFKDVNHVLLSSNACLPIKSGAELRTFLEQNPQKDFIESAAVDEAYWAMGGLSEERFTLYFPLSWRRWKTIFNALVNLQRKLRVKRPVPKGLQPHLGSQWWCLTRRTLTAILNDPERKRYDNYWKKVWIPDESYFQTLARKHATDIQSKSLTLSRFDYQGKPHVFYDDHLALLKHSGYFLARKIWPHADLLYSKFLNPTEDATISVGAMSYKLDKMVSEASNRRVNGRVGLCMQSSFTPGFWGLPLTSSRYSVVGGFDEVFENFDVWLASVSEARVHGHLFAKDRVYFEKNEVVSFGSLSDSPKIRDYNPRNFLASLIWNARTENQCFLFGPQDEQDISWSLVEDPNAKIFYIKGAWLLRYFRSNLGIDQTRQAIAREEKAEKEFLNAMLTQWCRANVTTWSMIDLIERPMEPLQTVINDINSYDYSGISEAPKMHSLRGFGEYIRELNNHGLYFSSLQDLASEDEVERHISVQDDYKKPYLVK